ncbi:hypothetical protein [Natronoglomus mannanivorans]|uniref:Uncharacterized protein n=1 Tax=Natronoglomus mannanivorans TaxID=2979990 RepID=A0AAP2Z3H1_9EURY|nr:hypothetical protein [Halobacteria archaeon AArc-xg1-1]
MTRASSSKRDPADVQRDGIPWRLVRQIAVSLLLFSLFAIKPVLAQDDVVCDAEQLPGMISGFFQITTAIGIVGLVIVWQADSLAEMFTMNPEQKKGLKRHKRTALKSTVVLLVLGPLYTVAGSAMGLPLASCVDLVPW